MEETSRWKRFGKESEDDEQLATLKNKYDKTQEHLKAIAAMDDLLSGLRYLAHRQTHSTLL